MKTLLLFLFTMAVFELSAQTVLTQSGDPDIFPGNLAACNTSGPNTIEDNQFMRIFDTDNYNVQDTVFFLHIEMAIDSTSGGAYNLIGRVHEINGPILLSNMTLLATDTAAVLPDSSVYKMIIPFKDGYALPGDSIVAEVFAPVNAAIIFNPGANPYPETGPSFLVAPACGMVEPTPYSTIGFANIKLLLNLWVNHKPMLSNISDVVYKDNVLDFSKIDFTAAFSDYDSDTLEMVRVLALPQHGIIENNGAVIAVGDTLYPGDLDLLTYTPDAGYSGLDSFKVAARDNSHWSNGAATVTITVVDWQVSIDESVTPSFEIYPNPASTVAYMLSADKIESLLLYNSSGELIAQPDAAEGVIDISEQPAGTYFVTALSNGRWTIRQLIKN